LQIPLQPQRIHKKRTPTRRLTPRQTWGFLKAMSIPTVVFLDTSVLAGQQFNFASTAFMTFVPAAKKAGLKLVLPDPTEREVKRQIKERSQEALDALELARKRAPFLEKWTSFPKKSFPSVDTWEVTRVATDEWNAFLSQFSVVRLGYEHPGCQCGNELV
jgi:hypothetical protein